MKTLIWAFLIFKIIFFEEGMAYENIEVTKEKFQFTDIFERKPATVITAPLDGRPISNEYLENLVKMGGDRFIPANKEYLDKGFDKTLNGKWISGDSQALRRSILEQVKLHDNKETTVIINTSSYITRDLVGCRIPQNYDKRSITKALYDLDYLTNNCKKPRYYIHVMIPRIIPESRGFNYHKDYLAHGIKYFYNKALNNIESDDNNESFDEVLVQFGYVKYKRQKGVILSLWEEDFLNYFEQAYILNASEEFKENGVPLPLSYMSIFQQSSALIKSLMDRLYKGSVDEMVISVEDFNIPHFVYLKKNEKWVTKDAYGNPVKYSFSLACLNEIMEYQRISFGEKELKSSIESKNRRINFVYGTDEIPQMIYARDLTRRSGIATRFHVDFSHDVNVKKSKTFIGFFDVAATEDIINQRIHFVTRRTVDGFEKGVSQKQSARKFELFIHNSDIPELSTFSIEQANSFAEAVYDSYKKDNNVGVLDLQTNTVDWELFKALSCVSQNSVVQLGCYSGWNTIGNSTGLGIAHAQVFGIIDYLGGNDKKLASLLQWHGKILAQHLLEDALYNRKIKGEQPSDFEYINKNLFGILSSNQEYDQNGKPGGEFWVLNQFRNSKMRINNRLYRWGDVSLLLARLPFNRTFECQIDVVFSKLKLLQ